MRYWVTVAAGCWLILSSAAIAQDLPNGQNCAVVRQRMTDSIQLAVLCSRAVHEDANVAQADASCRASVELLTVVGPDVGASLAQTQVERDVCTPPTLVSNLRSASSFAIAYVQFRQDGSVPLPNRLVL